MATKALERELALMAYEKEHRETEALVEKMLSPYGEPKRSPAESRAALAKKLKDISVSRMIAEAR